MTTVIFRSTDRNPAYSWLNFGDDIDAPHSHPNDISVSGSYVINDSNCALQPTIEITPEGSTESLSIHYASFKDYTKALLARDSSDVVDLRPIQIERYRADSIINRQPK